MRQPYVHSKDVNRLTIYGEIQGLANLGEEGLQFSGGGQNETEVRSRGLHGSRYVLGMILNGCVERVVEELHDLEKNVY